MAHLFCRLDGLSPDKTFSGPSHVSGRDLPIHRRVNAFFIRQDLKPDVIKELSPEEGYVEGQFCEAHDTDGNFIKMTIKEQKQLVMSLPLVCVEEAGEP